MSQNLIHPTAVIDPNAQLGADVRVGPYCVIEAGVTIGDRTSLGPYVHIQGDTTIGPDNVIHSNATLGFPPQFIGFDGSATPLVIGARNTIREYVSINRGLTMDNPTRVGDDCFFMAASHIAHDCQVGNGVIMANGVLLAGHITVGDRAFISGNAAAHQFCRIGRLAMIGGLAKIPKDAPPFMISEGHPGYIRGVNSVGLKRAGAPPHVRMELKRLLHTIYLSGKNITQAIESLNPTDWSDYGRELIDFYKTSKRGVLPFSLAAKQGKAAANESNDED